MQAVKAKPCSNKGSKANFCHDPISTTYERNIQIQIKLIIGGADQSMRKIGFMPFFGLAGLQNKF